MSSPSSLADNNADNNNNNTESGALFSDHKPSPIDSFVPCEKKDPKKNGKVVLWVDGCFDFMHFGHANALRQAKLLYPNSYLICGVHSDEEIAKFKGPTVMNEQERYAAVRACRWVDECVENVPYVTKLGDILEHEVDFCVHGDDLTFDENGRDSYWEIKQAGKMKIVKRTQGISTTDLVQRMLFLAKVVNMKLSSSDDEVHDWDQYITSHNHISQNLKQNIANDDPKILKYRQFLPTVSKISQFAASLKQPSKKDKIIYVDGGFDLFHVGHMNFLKKAKELGSYLIIGLYEDSTINQIKGATYPIMNLHERVLSVLSCRYVDDVVIGAPYVITENLINSMNISLVVHGSVLDPPAYPNVDPYELPKKLGIVKQVESPNSEITTTNIVKRIIQNYLGFEKRNKKKLSQKSS